MTRPRSDVFRPRLPIDPFASIDVAQPWHIPPSLPHSAPQVILILGEPRPSDVVPLLTSPHLARSLLLIATHAPPCIPALPSSAPGPAVRILRLPAPLAAHDSGALRLVSLFERARRVACLWRHSASSSSTAHHRIIQLAEEIPDGEFTLVEPFVYASHSTKAAAVHTQGSNLRYPSPAPSIASSASSSNFPFVSPATSTSSLASHSNANAQRKKLQRTQSTLRKLMKDAASSTTQADTRTFDALLNFLPAGLPDKALLKHAILVSTLSAQYLTAPPEAASTAGLATTLPRNARLAGTTYPRSSSSPTPRPQSQFSPRRFSAFSFSSSASPSASPGTSPGTSPCPSPQPHDKSSQDNSNNNAKPKAKRTTVSVTRRISLLLRAPPPCASASSPSVLSESLQSPSDFSGGGRTKNAHLVHVLPVGWGQQDQACEELHVRQAYAPVHSSSLRPLASGGGGGAGPTRRSSSVPLLYHAHAQGLGGGSGSGSGNANGYGYGHGQEKPKLVQGIEQFLLSFAYPLGSVGSHASASSAGLTIPRASSRTSAKGKEVDFGLGVSRNGNGHAQGQGQRQQRPASAQYLSASMPVDEKRASYVSHPHPHPASSSSSSYSSPSSSRTSSYGSSSYGSATAPASSGGEQPRPTHPHPHLGASGVGVVGGTLGRLSQAQEQDRPVPYLVAPGVFGAGVGGSRGSSSFGCEHEREHQEEEYQEEEQEVGGGGDGGGGTRRNDKDKDKDKARELTIGEVVLLGALDFDHELAGCSGGVSGYAGEVGVGVGVGGRNGNTGSGRAWIGGVWDVVVVVVGSGSRKRALNTIAGGGTETRERARYDDDGDDGEVAGAVAAASKGVASAKSKSMRKRKSTGSLKGSGLPTPPESASSEEGDGDGEDVEEEEEGLVTEEEEDGQEEGCRRAAPPWSTAAPVPVPLSFQRSGHAETEGTWASDCRAFPVLPQSQSQGQGSGQDDLKGRAREQAPERGHWQAPSSSSRESGLHGYAFGQPQMEMEQQPQPQPQQSTKQQEELHSPPRRPPPVAGSGFGSGVSPSRMVRSVSGSVDGVECISPSPCMPHSFVHSPGSNLKPPRAIHVSANPAAATSLRISSEPDLNARVAASAEEEDEGKRKGKGKTNMNVGVGVGGLHTPAMEGREQQQQQPRRRAKSGGHLHGLALGHGIGSALRRLGIWRSGSGSRHGAGAGVVPPVRV